MRLRPALAAALLTLSGDPPATQAVDTYRGHFEDATAQPSYSFANVPIGSPAADRIVRLVIWANSSLSVSLASVTIGGVAASAVVPQGGAATRHLMMYQAEVPAGTLPTIAVTFSDVALRCGVAVWTTTGRPLAFSARTGSATTIGGVANSLALPAFNIPAGGFAIVAGWLGSATAGPVVISQTTGSNTTRLGEQLGSGAVYMVAADTNSAGLQTFTLDGGDSIQYLGLGASWGKNV